MRTIIALALALFAFGAAGQTAPDEQEYLLIKTSGGGFTAPQHYRMETCSLYEISSKEKFKMVIEKRFGALRSREEKILTMKNLKRTLSAALSEPLELSDNWLCDAPTTTIRARSSKVFTLFDSGGCGRQKKERAGANAKNLIAFIDQYCPKTYDFN